MNSTRPRILTAGNDSALQQSRFTVLPDGRWKDRFTGAIAEGENIEIEDVLRAFPVTLLSQEVQSHA
jgi:(1->4)-alpha-D-glucan 1-alpha-D-glucosylmutase